MDIKVQMKHISLNQGSIGNLLDKYKEVKVIKTPQPSLFPQLHQTWSAAQLDLLFGKRRCPICGSLLTFPRFKPNIALCKGKRHPDKQKFVISKEKLFKTK